MLMLFSALYQHNYTHYFGLLLFFFILCFWLVYRYKRTLLIYAENLLNGIKLEMLQKVSSWSVLQLQLPIKFNSFLFVELVCGVVTEMGNNVIWNFVVAFKHYKNSWKFPGEMFVCSFVEFRTGSDVGSRAGLASQYIIFDFVALFRALCTEAHDLKSRSLILMKHGD